jgi:cation:H+ antiporter
VGVAAAIPVFAASIAVTLAAAATFARRLDRLGAKHELPEVWIGLLTALAADGPEISSALIALIKGAKTASVGVIVGSNTFNLAAMVGVSVLLAGAVRVTRRTLLLEGAVGLAITAIVSALLLGWLPAGIAVALVASVLAPYLVLVLGGDAVARRLGLGAIARALARDGELHLRADHPHGDFATHREIALMAADFALIVAGSYGMVQAALSLGTRWGLAAGLVGTLILGPLTSLPNALTGIRLGTSGRGAALITEALNSNTINLVVGIAVPSLAVTLTAHAGHARIDLALLAGSTVATLAFLVPRAGMRRSGAALLIGLYAAFIAVAVS